MQEWMNKYAEQALAQAVAAQQPDYVTLRDWFAAQALLLVGKPMIGEKYYEKCAAEAYQIADAMLAARKKP